MPLPTGGRRLGAQGNDRLPKTSVGRGGFIGEEGVETRRDKTVLQAMQGVELRPQVRRNLKKEAASETPQVKTGQLDQAPLRISPLRSLIGPGRFRREWRGVSLRSTPLGFRNVLLTRLLAKQCEDVDVHSLRGFGHLRGQSPPGALSPEICPVL